MTVSADHRPTTGRTIADYHRHRLVSVAMEMSTQSRICDPYLLYALVVEDAAAQGIQIAWSTAEEYVAEQLTEIFANRN